MFFEENARQLANFVRISNAIGRRADYVQGGGGNTSVKLGNGLMAIKASGYRLSDVQTDSGYAVLDYKTLSQFYYDHEPSDFENVEAAGADCAKENTKTIEGLKTLRPSVEAGFHSILKTYVLHTHSVYANLAACSTACREIAELAFEGTSYSWGWVDYVDPGANLTFAIRDELKRVEKLTGKVPAVILMQNHGIIVHADDPNVCLAIQTDSNARLANFFGLTVAAFPEVKVKELAGGFYVADTPYLRQQLKDCRYTHQELMEQPLYPDQMVFLVGNYYMNQRGIPEGQGVANTVTGELLMNMDAVKAQTLTEILTAVFFVMEQIQLAGYSLSTMGEAAKSFIANWESEKYRRSLTEKRG
ncbi:MAG: class II aldolase/adducin family protein [Clostridia bacterium]|nr:class II aldolase/adducin family protein [Clostridia bacterium]